MISNQILQNTIDGLKAITRIDISVMDVEGKVIASTFEEESDYGEAVMAFVDSAADSQVLSGCQFSRYMMNISLSMSF